MNQGNLRKLGNSTHFDYQNPNSFISWLESQRFTLKEFIFVVVIAVLVAGIIFYFIYTNPYVFKTIQQLRRSIHNFLYPPENYQIEWSDITVEGKTIDDIVIGEGAFGVVCKAKYLHRNADDDVVIKVMTKSFKPTTQTGEASKKVFDKMLHDALDELEVMKTAESKIVYKDCIVKVYGIVSGILPEDLANIFHVNSKENLFGIVMRFEGGGTLSHFIYMKNEFAMEYSPSIAVSTVASDKSPISELNRGYPDEYAQGSPRSGIIRIKMREKIRILTGIARGLAELHTAGIVHADIKPDNILLSSDIPPIPRLADFGLSFLRANTEDDKGQDSSMQMTSHFRGTPIYAAPEMLVNPYADDYGKVAKPSRKTDIYAFAIMCWEVLCQEKPFGEVRSQTELASKVHQGYRPSLEKLPRETPAKVVRMMECCWSEDRSVRKSAIECFSTLQHQESILSQIDYDVYISHDDTMNQVMVSYMFHRLTQLGLRVYFQGNSVICKKFKVECRYENDKNYAHKMAIYERPDPTSTVIGKIKSGDEIEIYATTVGDGFYKLVDTAGYIRKHKLGVKWTELGTSLDRNYVNPMRLTPNTEVLLPGPPSSKNLLERPRGKSIEGEAKQPPPRRKSNTQITTGLEASESLGHDKSQTKAHPKSRENTVSGASLHSTNSTNPSNGKAALTKDFSISFGVRGSRSPSAHDVLTPSDTELTRILARCRVFMVCLSRAYQEDPNAMVELKEAHNRKTPLPVVAVYMEPDVKSWLLQEVIYLAQQLAERHVGMDVSSLAKAEDWLNETPSPATLQALHVYVDKLAQMIKAIDNELSPRTPHHFL